MRQAYHFQEIFATLRAAAHSFKQPIVTKIAEQKRDPFQVLISCILSLRTKDETTAPAALRLFRLAQTPERMVKLPVKRIERAIYPVGFYKTKTEKLFRLRCRCGFSG